MNWKLKAVCLSLVALWSVGCCTTCQEDACDDTQSCVAAPASELVVDDAPCVTAPAIENEQKGPKQLWANSFIWTKAPELKAEKWLSDQPDTKGKYILLEFWNTWCPPCRRSLATLNKYHEKFGDELAVIALIDEPEEALTKMTETHGVEAPKCYSAIDTSAFTKKAYGVYGVPHVVIIEPFEGCVVWEGFPGFKGYELTEEKIEKILEVGRQIRKENTKKQFDLNHV